MEQTPMEMQKQLEIRKAVLRPRGYAIKMLEEYGLQFLGHRADVYGGIHCAADPEGRCISRSPIKTFYQDWVTCTQRPERYGNAIVD